MPNFMDLIPSMNIEPSPGQSSNRENVTSNLGAQALNTQTSYQADTNNKNTKDCLEIVRFALSDVKAQNIVEIDVRGVTNFADTIVIASGTSTRHVKALADNVVEEAKKLGYRAIGVEGERDAEWILIDLSFVVIHVMLPTARKFYDLESLWQPAQKTA